ncbi:MAG TPA: inositol monophosphatase [Anaerolineae bacterium]|nr:inositol monophosphatase [Anaerolineae bacterium]
MNTILENAKDIAINAGELIKSLYRINGIQSAEKQDHTLVTKADISSNEFIIDKIMKFYPNDGIISEESGTVFPPDKEYVWIIDPLDGTTNFSLGLHYWGVSIARLKHGQPDLAIIYFPLLGELYSAQMGHGARLNEKLLKLNIKESLHRNQIFTHCSRTQQLYNVTIKYKTRIFGSAAFDVCAVASGRAILAFNATPKIWDFAGSWVIIREAGGEIATLNGAEPFPLVPNHDYKDASYPLLATPSAIVFKYAKTHILPK